MKRLVAGLVAIGLFVALVSVYVSWDYGEVTVGPRFAPNVCADLILKGPGSNGASFYIGMECDY